MANSEVIGGVSVTISGDYSSLQDDFAAAADIAQDAGAQVANAFESGADPVAETGAAVENLGNQAQEAAPKVTMLAESEQEASPAAEGLKDQTAELLTEFAKYATIGFLVDTLKDFAEECISAYAETERVSISLQAMGQSAEGAESTIEGLKGLAEEDALSFPSLLKAEQRMTAFGLSSDQITRVMQAAADAAAATGNSFDQVSNAIVRVGASGQVSARFLMQLGLTQQSLADSLGITTGELQKQFKAMDQEARINAIITALGKFQGVAEAAAEGTAGKWQRFKTDFEIVADGIGKALSPLTYSFLNFIESNVKGLKLWGEVLEGVGQKGYGALQSLGKSFTIEEQAAKAAAAAMAEYGKTTSDAAEKTTSHATAIQAAAPKLLNYASLLADVNTHLQKTSQMERELASAGPPPIFNPAPIQASTNALVGYVAELEQALPLLSQIPPQLEKLPPLTIAATTQTKELDKEYQQVERTTARAFAQIGKSLVMSVFEGKNWGKSLEQAAEHAASSIVGSLVGQAFKSLEESMIGIATKTLPQLASSFDASAAIGAEAVKVANTQTIASDSWVADAGTFAWWSSINPLIAPAMGAAAQGEVLAMAGPAASYDIGGMVPSDMLAQVHAGEWITPAGSVEANAGFGGAGGQNATFVLQGCTLYASNVDDLMNQMVKSLRRIGARI
jgi:hypothetical protein